MAGQTLGKFLFTEIVHFYRESCSHSFVHFVAQSLNPRPSQTCFGDMCSLRRSAESSSLAERGMREMDSELCTVSITFGSILTVILSGASQRGLEP